MKIRFTQQKKKESVQGTPHLSGKGYPGPCKFWNKSGTIMMAILLSFLLITSHASAQLSGSYTICSSGGCNYSSISAAVADLISQGVSGPVIFRISPGLYSEQVLLTSVKGASATNTITFDGGDSSKTIMSYYGNTTAPYTFELSGASYVTIKNMSIINNQLGSTSAFAMYLTGTSNYDTVSDCVIKVDTNTTSTLVIPVGIMGKAYTTGGNNGNYDVINNNVISGGFLGVDLYGTNTTTLCTGNQVTNNQISGAYEYGIYSYYQSSFSYSGNTITMRVTGSGGGPSTSAGAAGGATTINTYAITSYYGANHVISDNICVSSYIGILDEYADYSVKGDTSHIYNNMVSGQAAATSYGIETYYAVNSQVYFNTVYFTAPGGYAMYINNSGTASQGTDVRDNILYKTGSAAYCLYVLNATYVTNLDYNDYYNPGGNFVYFGGVAYPDLASLAAANSSFNQNCLDADPGFANLTPGSVDLHIGPKSYGVAGIYLNVPTDIDGDMRCKLLPNMGADETSNGKGKPIVKFYVTSNIYPNSPSYVYQTGKQGEPKLYQWYLINDNYSSYTLISDSAVLLTTKFTAGYNTLKLVTQSCGGNDSFIQTFMVSNPTKAPVTDFVANKNYISAGDIVMFQDLSTYGPTTWQWTITPDSTMSDGAEVPAYSFISGSLSSQNPIIQFLYPGEYSVCLTTKNDIGKGNMVCRTDYITVYPSINIGSSSLITDAKGYLYDDGGPDNDYIKNGGTPSVTIAPCADSVYLTFSMFDMNCGVSFLQIYEGRDNTGKRLDPCGGSGITSGFTGGPSSGIGCSSACLPNVSRPDTFKAKTAMFIQMNDGAATVGRGFAAYWWSKPMAKAPLLHPSFTFTGSNDSVCINGLVNFTNTTSDTIPDDNVTYFWDLDGDFSDGFECTGTCNSVSWPYFITGPVTVTLIASNCGGSDTMQKTVTVFNPKTPKPAIVADNTNPVVGDVVFFTAPIPQCVDDYKWTITKSAGSGKGTATFVNSTTNIEPSPDVTFSDTGYYDVKLYVDNLEGSQKDSLTKLRFIHVRSPYCVPSVATLNQGIGISDFSLGTQIENQTVPQAQTDYSSFTSQLGLSATLELGVSYPVSISRDNRYLLEPINRSIFIDWNQNGSFTDAGDEVANDSDSYSETWNGEITVPKTAKLGATVMRIAVNRGNFSNKPCGQNEFGEYQDYRVYITKFTTPPVITLNGIHGLADTIKIEQGLTYSDPGDSAYSIRYGNITNAVTITSKPTFDALVPGLYQFSYNVADSSGNKAITQYRLVKIMNDTTPPVLVVNSPDTTMLEVSKNPVHPLPIPKVISATDLVDGSLLSSVFIDSSKVISTVVGIYPVTYTVTDQNKDTAKTIRYIDVIDTIRPVLTLNGNSVDTLEVDTTYTDAGVSTTDNYYPTSQLDSLVKVTDSVDLTKIGIYSITYNVTDPSGNAAYPVKRTVVVVDKTKPMITLNGPATDSIAVFTVYNDPGVSVSDNYDKAADITITTTGTFYAQFPSGTKAKIIGSYTIIYTATDKSGNQASVSRTILVKDWTAPVITLVGPTDVSVCRWADYVDAGYTLSDNYDANANVIVHDTGTFITDGGTNLENLLTYQYIAVDKSGNVGYSAIRNILIKSPNEYPCSLSAIQPGLSLDKYIKVFPNPNAGVFTINADLPFGQDARITVTNMLGQQVAEVYNGTMSGNSIQVNLGNCPSGIYLLNIISGNQILTKRIEITK